MSKISPPDFTRYPTHDEMTALLHRWAAAYSDLATLESIGQSREGRDLWLMTVSDRNKGRPEEKPAIYFDGNIHAGEVLPSVVCLWTIWDLLSRFGEDERVSDLLHTRTFYLRPRVAPDGAERYLTTGARFRSAPIPWPSERPGPGLHPADVNGDGEIAQMRLRDPEGEWRASDRDPRLMLPRGVADEGQPRYRLMTEGIIEGSVGANLEVAAPLYGLDFNRSFPHNWQPESAQTGAGPYPLFPAETRASVDFVLAHPNIGIVVAYHTAGGFVFTLPSSAPSAHYRHGDLTGAYRDLTDAYTRLTGEPAFQRYDETTATARFGSFMDWAYNQLGIYGWVPELWNIWRAAGVERPRERFFAPPTEEEELALLRWNDEALGGQGFLPWQPFEHPQLGPVEIGGWTYKFTHQNPPGREIPDIARSHAAWTYLLAHALPSLAIERTHLRPVGGDLFALTVQVVNAGYLPTNISRQALEVGKAEPVTVSIAGETIEVVDGAATRDVGHLDGYRVAPGPPWQGPRPPRRRGEARFVLRAPGAAGTFEIRAASPRAGAATRLVDVRQELEAGGADA